MPHEGYRRHPAGGDDDRRKGEAAFVTAEPRKLPEDTPVALKLSHLAVDMPGEMVNDVSLEVREGEIFGIGGLAGQGKVGIPNGVMGIYPSTGEVELFGEKSPLNNARQALKNGMAIVSEDRRGVGLLLDESIENNVVFNAMQINGDFTKKFLGAHLRDGKAIRAYADEIIKELDIRCFSAQQHAGTALRRQPAEGLHCARAGDESKTAVRFRTDARH